MRNLLRVTGSVLLILTLAGCATAPPPSGAELVPPEPPSIPQPPAAPDAYLAKLPPLIDRTLIFGDPQIASAQISPDGRFISFRKPYRNVMNIWVKRVEEPFDAARPITADTERPVRGYFWTEDGRYILYVQDKGGDEDFHIYAVDPAAASEASTGVPPSRDLTPLKKVRAFIYAVPEKTPNEILIGLNDRDPAYHDVYRLNLRTGKRTLLVKNDQKVAGWVADHDGNIRLAVRQTEDGGFETLTVSGRRVGKQIYRCSFEEFCEPLRFHKDNRLVYFETNKGDRNLTELTLLDPKTGATTLVESDPENEVDFGVPIFSDATEELIATIYVGDRRRIYPRNPTFARDLEILRSKLPDGEIGISSRTNDDRLMLVSVNSDINPGSTYLYNRDRGTVEKLYDLRPDLPSEQLAPMQPIRYRARDGVEIPGYLTIPKGADPKDLPVMIMPHGGPWARDVWGFDSWAQFLANRGYAVLQPNFRGSTGYGKRFLNAGNLEWGTGIMQHDISDGVKDLIDRGIADPSRVAIMGGSYGGYATLAGVTFTPDLYAAGVSIVGPSNIFTLLRSIPPYWTPVKKMFLLRVGDPDDARQAERLRAQSPFFHARQIKSPLLVIQGANDPRVKKAESDQIVVALRDLDRGVEYIVAPDEGHGFAGKENRLAMTAAVEKFLAGHLGGRYQESMEPEVGARLASISVDVKTVQMPASVTELLARSGGAAPRLMADALQPMKLDYSSTIKVGTREMTVESTREMKKETLEGRKIWRLETSSNGPMGAAKDVFIIDATTLAPVRRTAQQGPATVELSYSEGAVTGMMKAAGREIPINAKLDGPIFGEEAALDVVLGSLPLEAGYKTTVRTFDLLSQKVRTWSVEVAEPEAVDVPAGSYQAYRVKMVPIDGDPGGATVWITSERPRIVVKSETMLPPMMGGGTVNMVLKSRPVS